jgi:hypothetical protein
MYARDTRIYARARSDEQDSSWVAQGAIECLGRGSPELSRVRTSGVLRITLAMVLLTAATLKVWELIIRVPPQSSSWPVGWTVAAVGSEMFVAIWLLTGQAGCMAWRAVTVMFACFAAAAVWKASQGAATCGCFGPVSVSPWFTAAFDICAVIALWLTRPQRQPAAMPPARWRAPAAVVLLLAATCALALHAARRGILGAAAAGLATGGDGIVILDPQDWIGQRFPLLDHIDAPADLAHGTWLLLLYRADCPLCHEAIPAYAALSARMPVMLLEMPSDQTAALFRGTEPTGAAHAAEADVGPHGVPRGRVRPDRLWFLTTPTAILLQDGRVQHVRQGNQAVEPSPVIAPIPFRGAEPTAIAAPGASSFALRHSALLRASGFVLRALPFVPSCPCASS